MGCGTSVKTENQSKKSEKAIRAAVLIQRWYRFYRARLEMRRRYTLSIFQSIEYAEEQAQLQLSNFFTFMMDHFAHINEQKPGPDLLCDIFKYSQEGHDDRIVYEGIEVPDSYDGPRLSFPLSVSDTNNLLHAFKQEKQLHERYILQLFYETKKFLSQMPNIVYLTTSFSRQITICVTLMKVNLRGRFRSVAENLAVVLDVTRRRDFSTTRPFPEFEFEWIEARIHGDLHGKLDDLLLIFYKNGLPSAENTYLFNGDFVDRGKNSMEILILLFAFLLVYPNNLHLNRGNHEDPIMNLRYGFTKEIMQKYKIHSKKILDLLEDIYSQLPLATVIDNKVLILHGGIADSTDLDILVSVERTKYKSALRTPKPKSDIDNGMDLDKSPSEAFQFFSNSENTFNYSPQTSPELLYSPKFFSYPQSITQNEELSSNPEKHDLNSHMQLPDMTTDLTAMELEEWKQVVDILWSDPRKQNGCTPNSFRGGGCYFGPDVTAKLLEKFNLKMLIRSHECKQEGYEVCHDGKVVTIFSASNYYDEGSNRGAYVKLSPDLTPQFVQYQVSKTTRKLTLTQRVNAVEDSALRALREQFYAHRSDLIKAFKAFDPDGSGRIASSDWAIAVEMVLNLDLPWRTLRSRLTRLTSEGYVDYMSSFEDLQVEKPIEEVQPSLVEILYRYRADLEIIFNIIDKDHSGLISIEEFHQTWKLFSSHLNINIDDSTIEDLVHHIDSNKDGSIDFNEFLEAFRVVHKFDKRSSQRR